MAYITGIHNSIKCNTQIKYRSGYELRFAVLLDNDPDIVKYSYESLSIPYISNEKTKKVRTYYPDFLVERIDRKKIVVEIKRADRLKNKIVQKKAAAAEAFLKIINVEYEIWTKKDIDRYQKNLEKALSKQIVIPYPPKKIKKRKAKKLPTIKKPKLPKKKTIKKK